MCLCSDFRGFTTAVHITGQEAYCYRKKSKLVAAGNPIDTFED